MIRQAAEGPGDSIADVSDLFRQKPIPAEALARIRSAVMKYEPAERMLHLAVKERAFRYPIELTNGFKTPLPHLSGIKNSAYLLSVKAGLSILDGDAGGATDALATGLRTADSLTEEPVVIASLVRVASHLIICERAAFCLTHGRFSHADLGRLEAALSEGSSASNLFRAVLGERVNAMDFFHVIQNAEGYWKYANSALLTGGVEPPWWHFKSLKSGAVFYAYKGLGNDVADKLHLVRSLTAFSDVFRQPPQERMVAMSNAVWNALSAPGTGRYLVSQIALQALDKLAKRDLMLMALHRTFRVALALEHFRLDSGGALPDSLDVLVPKHLAAVPADPFTGQPLRYIRNGRGYVVYSVGENLTDEQGAPKSDVPFIVEK